ncbi:MAG: hypothetical protein SGBAC_005246 [Bacillariaceae sp.]
MEEAASLVQEKVEVNREEKIEPENKSEPLAKDDDANQQDAHDTLSMSDLSIRMHCPINYKVTLPFLYSINDEGKTNDAPESSLSYIPWRLRMMEESCEKGETNGETDGDKPSVDSPTEDDLVFPSSTYLDLRRQQNNSWASDRLKEGNEVLFINPNKAETKFLEGLDLVPDHADLLTAYAKFLMMNNDFAAAETKLKHALETDPDHKLAQKTQLELVRKKEGRIRMGQQQQQQQQQILQDAPKSDFLASRNVEMAKGNSIYSDVLMERALAMGDNDDADDGDAASDNSSRSRRRKKSAKKDRKRKKKKKKPRRKRRRRYYSSESGEDVSSCSVLSGDSTDDARKKKGNDDDQKDKGDSSQQNDRKEERNGDEDPRVDRRRRNDKKRSRKYRKRRRQRYSSESDVDNGSRAVPPDNANGHAEDDGRKNKDENNVGYAEDDTKEQDQQDERSDADSESDRRFRKRRRRRDDRRRRHCKKHLRTDSSS